MCDHEHAIHKVTGLEAELADLRNRVAALEAALHVELAVGEVIAEGNTSAPAIATALRKRADDLTALRGPGRPGIHEHPADVERRMWLGTQFYALANEIDPGEGK